MFPFFDFMIRCIMMTMIKSKSFFRVILSMLHDSEQTYCSTGGKVMISLLQVKFSCQLKHGLSLSQTSSMTVKEIKIMRQLRITIKSHFVYEE